ncbi:MAG: ATP-binding protein [Pseudomonadota bacterium]
MKIRPRLSAILMVVNLAVILLPLGSIFFFRIYENQLIQETERELISQAAIIAAFYQAQVAVDPLGGDGGETAAVLQPANGTRRGVNGSLSPGTDASLSPKIHEPIRPRLDLAKVDTLPERPDGREPLEPSTQLAVAAGKLLSPMLERAQVTSLAGIRVLDSRGTVVGGTAELGLNFAHVWEVKEALAGRYTSALRFRELTNAPSEFSSLATISRGTKVRVFVAFPVVEAGQTLGVVYLSRTPRSVLRHMYEERDKAILALLTVLLLALGLAWLTSRTISRPMAQLLARTGRVAKGESATLPALKHPGTKEMAELSEGIEKMADALVERAAYIRTLATHVSHEFKTPLASIQGAAELLHDMGGEMTDAERERFVQTISAGGDRLRLLLDRLLELARAENAVRTDERVIIARLASAALSSLPSRITPRLDVPGDLRARIPEEALSIVLGNLVDNAVQHGATKITVEAQLTDDRVRLSVTDDGEGVSAPNREKIFEHFFTTRRDSGGTGLGLGIVRALLNVHGGEIRLADTETGARFDVLLRI